MAQQQDQNNQPGNNPSLFTAANEMARQIRQKRLQDKAVSDAQKLERSKNDQTAL